MRYLHMYRSETSATSTDQVVISSNYLERPDFDFSIPLHSGLHYVFVRGAGMATNAKGYELRMAINKFLDFATGYNSNIIPALKISSLNDIGAEEYKRFEDYLLRNNLRIYLAIRLKSAFVHVARRFEDGMPALKLPVIEEPKFNPSEPLSDQTDDDLYKAMYREVDLLREKLAFQRAVYITKPYDSWEVWEISRDLLSLGYGKLSTWAIDPLKAAATLQYHGFPFYIRPALMKCLYYDASVGGLSPIGRTPLEFVLSCCLDRAYLRRRAPGCISFRDLFKLMYPTATDQATLALFTQRQLGWNKETVLALDKDRFVHPMSELAKEGVVVVISTKTRSQGQGKSFISPKTMVTSSSRTDPYSGYNLIRLACDLSESCRGYLKLDPSIEVDDKRHQTPFLFFQDPVQPWIPDDRLSSLDAPGHWQAGVQRFLARAQLVENGEPLVNVDSLSTRLRVTSLQNNKNKRRQPIALTALLYGHADSVTTDNHYDSSVSAMAGRRTRFHDFQQRFIQKGQEGLFKGLMGKPIAQESIYPRFRIFTLIGHERPLWACLDCTQPSYPGSKELPSGARCTRLDKCNGCEQWCVLEDSLPFLMERQAVLEILVERDPGAHDDHADEIQVLKYLVDKLKNKSLLESASLYRSKYEVLLPVDLKSLIAYVED
ncbi:hypothetical protein D3C76_687790 [compost metagenome]